MNRHRDDQSLQDELSRLPQVQASADFTRRVLTALDDPTRDIPTPWNRRAWIGATAVVLLALIGLGIIYQRQRAAEVAYQRQVDELRSRYEQLLEEVVSIRQEAAAPDTRLYLGGDESLDLMLDMSQPMVPSPAGPGDAGQIRPASWEH